MRVIAAAAMVAFLSGPAGTCPAFVACTETAGATGHHCCCGDVAECQCHIGDNGPRVTEVGLAPFDNRPSAAPAAPSTGQADTHARPLGNQSVIPPLQSGPPALGDPSRRYLLLHVFRC
jgi:hypothetical protein